MSIYVWYTIGVSFVSSASWERFQKNEKEQNLDQQSQS